MSAHENKPKKRPVGIMVLTGMISIALYATLLMNQETIIGNFAKCGLYALLPIATAFAFSFIHGSFTGHFWTVLGIEAARKKMEVK